MNIEEIRQYCLEKVGTTEDFPFDESTLVFRIEGKIFLLCPLDKKPICINLKCNPEKAIELREKYDFVVAGFHMNKRHWNTVYIEDVYDESELYQWIDHSYDLVKNKNKSRKKV